MTDNPLTLFCLVDGETTSFPVEIESTRTVGDLKKLIKAEQTILLPIRLPSRRAQEGSQGNLA
ncbi:hypothetical protein B0O80DRAFT_476327, partial [Mortierella sp. GBAus27b]